MTIRLIEGVNASLVTLRVSGDRIPPMDLEPTGFSVVGVLDGVVFQEFAQVAFAEPEEVDWGC